MNHVYVSGNLGLDLVGTLKWRRDEREELLAAPRDLDDWIVGAGILTQSPVSTSAELDDAVRLREAVYALVEARLGGAELPTDPLEVLNEWNLHEGPTTRLTRDGVERNGGTPAALSEVARAATSVLSRSDIGVLKECANERCTRVFLDGSRGSRRAWCGMAECGNRAKAAAYRARKKEGAAPSRSSSV